MWGHFQTIAIPLIAVTNWGHSPASNGRRLHRTIWTTRRFSLETQRHASRITLAGSERSHAIAHRFPGPLRSLRTTWNLRLGLMDGAGIPDPLRGRWLYSLYPKVRLRRLPPYAGPLQVAGFDIRRNKLDFLFIEESAELVVSSCRNLSFP